jgi:hypothetical protein
MARISKNSTDSEKNAIKWVWEEPSESWYEVNRQMDSWRERGPTIDLINKIRAKMVEWVQKKDSEYFESFLDDLNIPHSVYYKWLKKYPELRETHTRVMNHIGRRREYGARKGGDSATMTSGTIGQFWTPWRREQVFKGTLAVKIQEILAKNKQEFEGLSIEELSNCIFDRIVQEWGDTNEIDARANTETTTIPTETISK